MLSLRTTQHSSLVGTSSVDIQLYVPGGHVITDSQQSVCVMLWMALAQQMAAAAAYSTAGRGAAHTCGRCIMCRALQHSCAKLLWQLMWCDLVWVGVFSAVSATQATLRKVFWLGRAMMRSNTQLPSRLAALRASGAVT